MMIRISLAAALAVAGIATSTLGAPVTVTTVGDYAPNPNNLTITNATPSGAHTNGITLADFRTLLTTAFANNTGGVWNADSSSGPITLGNQYGENAENAITAKYGTSQANSLSFYRTDGSLNPVTGISPSGNGTTQLVSGDGVIGFSQDSAPDIAFTQGLSHLGLTLVHRSDNGARSATLSALLDNHTSTNPSRITSTAGPTSSNNAFFYGFVAPEGRTIVGLEIVPTGGFARFDDLGFVVVPEPASLGLLGLGGLAMLRRRRA